MSEYRYGPVDFYLLGLPSNELDAATIAALTDLLEDGQVRLLDFVLLTKSGSGNDYSITEIGDGSDLGRAVGELATRGLAGDEDLSSFADRIPPGRTALLVALELVYQRRLAGKVAESGAVLLAYDRVPAPVVNALIDVFEESDEVAEMEN